MLMELGDVMLSFTQRRRLMSLRISIYFYRRIDRRRSITLTLTSSWNEKKRRRCFATHVTSTAARNPPLGTQVPAATQQPARRATALTPTPRRRRDSPA